MLVGLQECILDRILGVFTIMRDVLSNAEKLAIVSCYQLLKCRYITTLSGVDKLQIIARCCLPYELCAACSHIGLSAGTAPFVDTSASAPMFTHARVPSLNFSLPNGPDVYCWED